MPDRTTLPDWPRVMAEPRAAAYLDMSPGTFRKHVMPEIPPVPLTPGRQGWDRRALDAWVDRRAGRTAPSAPVNEWDALLAGDDAAVSP